MTEKSSKNILYIKGFIIIIYLVGVLGLSLSFSRELFQYLTPLNLIITTVLLFYFHSTWNYEFITVSAIIVALSIFAEGLGTNYGILFGEYKYGSTLGLTIWNVPFLIGINWLVLSYGAYVMVKKWRINHFLKIVMASLFLVLYDILLERPAGKLDMWNWENNFIPLKNYITWFIFAFLFISMLSWKKIEIRNPVASFLILTQFVFFLILNVTLEIWVSL